MTDIDFERMSVNELWALRENIGSVLTTKLEAEKHKLQKRLDYLVGTLVRGPSVAARQRQPYPKVNPKYQNPLLPSQTWAGRGLQPHWVRAMIKSGKTIDDLRIAAR